MYILGILAGIGLLVAFFSGVSWQHIIVLIPFVSLLLCVVRDIGDRWVMHLPRILVRWWVGPSITRWTDKHGNMFVNTPPPGWSPERGWHEPQSKLPF
jgi:hypothetical protein